MPFLLKERLAYLTSAPFLRLAHGSLTLAWLSMIPVVLLTGLKASIPFLVTVSLYANIVGHWSSWQAARVEVKQDDVKIEAENANVEAENANVEATNVSVELKAG